VKTIKHTLLYLRESLANYTKDELGLAIYQKIETQNYKTEEEFVQNLDAKEVDYLDSLLKEEINYANSAKDTIRTHQLNEIYELLF